METENKKVYLLYDYSYLEDNLVGIFSDREDALEYAEEHYIAEIYIEKREIDALKNPL